MHLRQRRGNIQNIIIVFPDNEASIASLYLPIQVDKAYAAEIISGTGKIFTVESTCHTNSTYIRKL